MTNIFYPNSQCDLFPICCDLHQFILRFAIRKSIAKRIKRLYAKTVKIAVTDKDILHVIFLQIVAVIGTKSSTCRIILVIFCPGIGQMTGWTAFSCQDICQRISGLHTCLS